MALAAIDPACTHRRNRDADRPVRPAVCRVRPARSSTASGVPPTPRAPADDRDPARAELARGSLTRWDRARRSPAGSADRRARLHDAVVLLNGDSALLHLGDDKFLERVQSYLELSPALARARRRHRLRGSPFRSAGIRPAGRGAAAGSTRPLNEHEGGLWHVRNATWSAWTSARRRSPRIVGETGDEGSWTSSGSAWPSRKASAAGSS